MKARETVLSSQEIYDKFYEVRDVSGTAQRVAEAQAEISFKAGEVEGFKKRLEMREPYKAGIKEVVEWLIDSNLHKGLDFEYWKVLIYKEDWQAKLKEWGLK